MESVRRCFWGVDALFAKDVGRSPIELIVLIGLPASGKSTLARQWVADAPCLRLISTDDIRANLFGDEATQGPWPLIWREIERQFYTAVEMTRQGTACGAIYDATNAVRRHRCAAMRLAIALGFTHLTGVWLDVPLEVCLAQNQTRQRQVPQGVIEQMHRCLQGAPPRREDGFSRLLRYQNVPVGKLHPHPP